MAVPIKNKNGKSLKPLDREDIERAMRVTLSNKGAARYLCVSLEKYKKYASMFTDNNGINLYEKHKNKSGAGVPKMSLRKNYTPGLLDLLEGRVNTLFFSMKNVKERLIKEGFIKEECGRCGFKERRVLDQKVPVILHFKDGNKKNWKLDNLEFLCYNCYYLVIGDVFEKNQLDAMERYTSLVTKNIDLDLPPSQEKLIKESVTLENKYVPEKETYENFGDDLISFIKPKK